MPIDVHIRDPKDDIGVGIGIDGRMFTGPSNFSSTFNAELATDDVVFNIVPAKADHRFIITDIVMAGNKNINTNVDAVVTIYEADSPTNTVSLATVVELPVARSGQLIMNGVFLGCGESAWVNGITTDDDVFVSIFGHYIKIDEARNGS